MTTAKRESASAYRNEEPIRAQLTRLLAGAQGHLLEVAAGTGQHAAAFSAALPQLVWWPTDLTADNLASIEAWRSDAQSTNLQPAQILDVTSEGWMTGTALPPLPESIHAILCCNMVHISPWAATEGLFAGAAQRLAENGLVFLYGPYRRNGQHTSDGNMHFDASLRAQDASWGIRDLEDMDALGRSHGLMLDEVIEMPANNLSLIFRPQQG